MVSAVLCLMGVCFNAVIWFTQLEVFLFASIICFTLYLHCIIFCFFFLKEGGLRVLYSSLRNSVKLHMIINDVVIVYYDAVAGIN